MVRQILTARVDTSADGAYGTPLGIVLEADRDAATFAGPSYSGSGPAGIVLAGGLAPIGALADGAAVPALLGRNDATGLDGSGIVYTGTYVNGIVLSDPATQNPATVAATGYVTNQTMTYNGDVIYGAPGYSWTITNLGTVKSTAFNADRVHLTGGGVLTNGQSAST